MMRAYRQPVRAEGSEVDHGLVVLRQDASGVVASRLMAEHAFGHVPVLRQGRVVKRGKLAGILSVTDVCRVLTEVLRERFPDSGGNDAA